jgi:hypothetical protein
MLVQRRRIEAASAETAFSINVRISLPVPARRPVDVFSELNRK